MSANFNNRDFHYKLTQMMMEDKKGAPPPPMRLKKPRDLIILVFYISIGNISEMKARDKIREVKAMINESIKGMEKDTNYKVSALVIPSKGDPRVECIFPKEKDEVISEFLQEMKEQKLLP